MLWSVFVYVSCLAETAQRIQSACVMAKHMYATTCTIVSSMLTDYSFPRNLRYFILRNYLRYLRYLYHQTQTSQAGW